MINISLQRSDVSRPQVKIDSNHSRAICDEIGERLRYSLDRDTEVLPLRLLSLLGQMFEQEYASAPSIVPVTADMSRNLGDSWTDSARYAA